MFLLFILILPFLWWYSLIFKYKNLNKIPGPKPLPFVGNALELGTNPNNIFNTVLKYNRKYGDIYKIFVGPELHIFFASPELFEALLSSNVHISKSSGYDLLKAWLGDGLLISTGNKWKIRRKMITPTFHFKILEQFVETFNSAGEMLIENLSKHVGNESVQLVSVINLYTLDIICETSMGVKINAQINQNREYVKAVKDYLDIVFLRFFSVWRKYYFLFKFTAAYKVYVNSLKILHGFTNDVIKLRREQFNKRRMSLIPNDEGIKQKIALLDMLLESENSHKLSNEDLREEIDTFMFEGHDTTTSGICFALLCLANNSDVQEKLHEEIISVIGSNKNLNVTIQHLQEMKYLDRFIKEAQRYYPSVPMIERKLQTDCSINGYSFKKDLTVSMFIYGLHHSEKYYPNPEKFDPDRFLIEAQTQRHNYAYVPFSAGPRNCIGQKFAIFEMKIAIIKIVKNFKLLSVPDFKPKLEMTGVLTSLNGVCVRLEHR